MNEQMWPFLILLGIGLLIGIGLMILINRAHVSKSLDVAWYREQWQGINQQAKDGESGRLLAVMNGDKLLDKAMQARGFGGENMGQRLKKNPGKFTKLNNVWSAHKLRNRIAHESGVKVSEAEAKRALKGFEQGLRDLGAI